VRLWFLRGHTFSQHNRTETARLAPNNLEKEDRVG
jgi:hypothetical protein